jgi:hypothetical protein
LGLPLFSSDIFVLSSLRFGVASFFIRGLGFYPMNKGRNNAPSFVAGLSGVTTFVKYRASVASDLDNGDQCFGERSLYYYFGVTCALPH